MFEIIPILASAEFAIIALLAAGTTATVVSQVEQGKAAKSQADFQSKIAARNAEQARKEAEGQRQAAAEAAIEQERQGRQAKGRRIAGQAKSGTAIGRGSNLAALVAEAEILEADRLTILREGAIRGSSLDFEAGNILAQGRAAKARGSAAKRASVLSAVGTGLSGAASIGMASSKFGTGTKTNNTIPSRASLGLGK
jgi:hypothetical protein